MALPGDVLATEDFPAEFFGGRNNSLEFTRDFETGGIALSDPSQGHLIQVWEAYVADTYSDVVIKNESGNFEATIYEGSATITEISFTFDQNMRQVLAVVENEVAKLDWYDAEVEARVITEYPDIRNPRVSLDDKRSFNIAESDVIFAYIRNGNLYHRRQRDRYQVEYLLAEDVLLDPDISYLRRIGMNLENRFQFEIFTPWTQDEILADLLTRAADSYTEITPPYQVSGTTAITFDSGSSTVYRPDNEESQE